MEQNRRSGGSWGFGQLILRLAIRSSGISAGRRSPQERVGVASRWSARGVCRSCRPALPFGFDGGGARWALARVWRDQMRRRNFTRVAGGRLELRQVESPPLLLVRAGSGQDRGGGRLAGEMRAA